MSAFRPLLSATIKTSEDLRKLSYPLIGSPKVDGIRCIVHRELGPVTRKLIPVPNRYIHSELMKLKGSGLDGELVVASLKPRELFDAPPSQNPMTDPAMFQMTQSGVMSHSGRPEFFFYVFDQTNGPTHPYTERLHATKLLVEHFNQNAGYEFVRFMPYQELDSPEAVDEYEARLVAEGYEGAMLRSPDQQYKYGRSTLKQQHLMKMKRFIDDECEIIGFKELMRNNNESVLDETGYGKRSTHKEGMVPGGTLGKFYVRNSTFGEFSIGSGLNDSIRAQVWADRESFLGRTISFKYQPVGIKEKPRLPIFKGFRGD